MRTLNKHESDILTIINETELTLHFFPGNYCYVTGISRNFPERIKMRKLRNLIIMWEKGTILYGYNYALYGYNICFYIRIEGDSSKGSVTHLQV